MQPRNANIATVATIALSVVLFPYHAGAVVIGPGGFEDPLVFDFSDLTSGTTLGSGYANPYEELGVEFTGFITSYDYGDIRGRHLATGFANSPPEPYVVRLTLLGAPAIRIGGYVWPEYGGSTSVTAFDDYGTVIDSFSVVGSGDTPFMGIEAPIESPIRFLEWRGPVGSSFTTFPRVDGVMINLLPEPATVSLLLLGAAATLLRVGWRERARA